MSRIVYGDSRQGDFDIQVRIPMDDRAAYLLNGIVQRDFCVGRIIRFRKLTRGVQCDAIEILTSERQSFLVLIYPQAYSRQQLNKGAEKSVNLAAATFPSLHFIEPSTSDGGWVVDGPQGSHLMVAKFPVGQPLPDDQWNSQDLSQLGIRLGWMHRMTNDADHHPARKSLYAQLTSRLSEPSPRRNALLNVLDAGILQKFIDAQKDKLPMHGWAHGGINHSSVLLDDDRQITAVIDWGLAGDGSNHEDAVDVFVRWCVDADGQIRATEARAFLEAFLSLAPEAKTPDWRDVVDRWCMRQLDNALLGYRQLPQGFGSIIRNPSFLSTAIALCQNKSI